MTFVFFRQHSLSQFSNSPSVFKITICNLHALIQGLICSHLESCLMAYLTPFPDNPVHSEDSDMQIESHLLLNSKSLYFQGLQEKISYNNHQLVATSNPGPLLLHLSKPTYPDNQLQTHTLQEHSPNPLPTSPQNKTLLLHRPHATLQMSPQHCILLVCVPISPTNLCPHWRQVLCFILSSW